jgi:hypothetical protein
VTFQPQYLLILEHNKKTVYFYTEIALQKNLLTMNSFYKVAGIVRIIFVEFIITLCLNGFVANLAQDIEDKAVKSDLSYLITVFLIGNLALFWLIWSMIKPKRSNESGISSNMSKYSFSNFCSTHPSYILIDLVLLFWAFAFSEFDTTTTFELYRKDAAYVIAIFIPVLRLFLWYIVGLKFPKEDCKDAWKPIMWFCIIVAPFALLYVISSLIN